MRDQLKEPAENETGRHRRKVNRYARRKTLRLESTFLLKRTIGAAADRGDGMKSSIGRRG